MGAIASITYAIYLLSEQPQILAKSKQISDFLKKSEIFMDEGDRVFVIDRGDRRRPLNNKKGESTSPF